MTTIAPTRAYWPAITATAVGIFTVVTSEMMPIGLLTPISGEMGVSDGVAGLTMSAPGLVAAAAAPVLAMTVRRLDRRLLLAGLMGLLVVSNLVAALAPDFTVLMAARVVTGVSIGGYWAFAASIAVRLVPPGSVGRATAMIAGGVSVASVLGVPTGTLIASMADWRWAFAAMALLALVVTAALLALLPSLPAQGTVSLGGVWRDPGMRAVLIVIGVVVIGHFGAYTYVRPFLELSGADISLTLLAYGVAGVVGNFVAGSLAATRPKQVIITLAVLIAVATAVLPLMSQPLPLVVLWGVAYGGVSVTSQLWMIKAGGGESGMAWVSSVFNATIAAGALVGGRIVDGVSLPAVLWFAAVMALLSAAFAGTSGRSRTSGS
ncbi:MFS transporter [Nonomuraea sp. NPDC050790]|uniref:MFS transporter n=1 Tax=Nonomuraea sp. NPDC050790 TaxID=3364371 RepID=UPI0037BA1333